MCPIGTPPGNIPKLQRNELSLHQQIHTGQARRAQQNLRQDPIEDNITKRRRLQCHAHLYLHHLEGKP